uniref:Uncharacterized protein n=1 Tax=Ciona savignyi TaxID=51511 RepID=H2YN11_CIOSA
MNQQWGGNTHPSNRQPAIPPREEENTYLPIDQPTSIGERGRGMMPPNTRPPVQPPFPNRYPVNPRSPHDRPNFDRPQHERFPFDRPPMDRPPMDRPSTDRPAMPVPPPFIQPEEPDTYEPVNAPTRPPPAIPQLPPTNFGTRSPGSSFNSNRSIGFSPPVSFKESGMSQNHSPYRNGSRDSTSSGEHSDPPQPSPGIPKTQVPKHHGFQLPKNDQTSK